MLRTLHGWCNGKARGPHDRIDHGVLGASPASERSPRAPYTAEAPSGPPGQTPVSSLGLGESGFLECVVNVSEGRDEVLLGKLVEQIDNVLLDLHRDPSHHRCVITLGGRDTDVEAAARSLTRRAVDLLDLGAHRGAHPRFGVVDVVPFVPLAPQITPGGFGPPSSIRRPPIPIPTSGRRLPPATVSRAGPPRSSVFPAFSMVHSPTAVSARSPRFVEWPTPDCDPTSGQIAPIPMPDLWPWEHVRLWSPTTCGSRVGTPSSFARSLRRSGVRT